MLLCIFILDTLFSCFNKFFPSLLVLLCIFSVDILSSFFIKVFPSLLVLFSIFILDALFSCFIKVFWLCILSFDIPFSCLVKVFFFFAVALHFQTGYSFFVISSTLARLSCCRNFHSYLSLQFISFPSLLVIWFLCMPLIFIFIFLVLIIQISCSFRQNLHFLFQGKMVRLDYT